ncbi:hypothetical protein D3C85_1854520 [compost metagenome]
MAPAVPLSSAEVPATPICTTFAPCAAPSTAALMPSVAPAGLMMYITTAMAMVEAAVTVVAVRAAQFSLPELISTTPEARLP